MKHNDPWNIFYTFNGFMVPAALTNTGFHQVRREQSRQADALAKVGADMWNTSVANEYICWAALKC